MDLYKILSIYKYFIYCWNCNIILYTNTYIHDMKFMIFFIILCLTSIIKFTIFTNLMTVFILIKSQLGIQAQLF